MKCCTVSHGPLRMKPADFGDLQNVHPASSSDQNLNLSNTLIYDQIPEKLMTFPSASAALCI